MRLFLSALVTALIVPLAAHSQAPKPVEVINDPLAVEVVNPAPPSQPVRWQLVGFTRATYTGAMGGNFGVTQKCQLEFPNSRMCSLEEVMATTSIPSSLAGNAWTHPDPRTTSSSVILDASVEPISNNCRMWRVADDSRVHLVSADGAREIPEVICSTAHPIACCALVP